MKTKLLILLTFLAVALPQYAAAERKSMRNFCQNMEIARQTGNRALIMSITSYMTGIADAYREEKQICEQFSDIHVYSDYLAAATKEMEAQCLDSPSEEFLNSSYVDAIHEYMDAC